MKNLYKSLAVLGVVVLLGFGGNALAGQSLIGEIRAEIRAKVVALGVEKYFGLVSKELDETAQPEVSLGSAQTPATYATAGSVTNQGGLYLWDTESNSGLEVKGPTHLASTTITSLTVTTGTVAYAPGQVNVANASFNAASTTLCSIQNTSGLDRVVQSGNLYLTGTTGGGGLTSFRSYVSAARADNNTTATSTVIKETQLTVAANVVQVTGGPVPGSYYTSSTVPLTALNGVVTTTPVLWKNGWFFNVTSTAITSSTGICMANYVSF